jgi:hypothetical protein
VRTLLTMAWAFLTRYLMMVMPVTVFLAIFVAFATLAFLGVIASTVAFVVLSLTLTLGFLMTDAEAQLNWAEEWVELHERSSQRQRLDDLKRPPLFAWRPWG